MNTGLKNINQGIAAQNSLNQLKWNIVAKNFDITQYLQKKIHHKISKLERYLKNFPPDTVHLHIRLERNPKNEQYVSALTLRVPSNIIHSEKRGKDMVKVFNDAVDAMFKELNSLKSELRREIYWKRKDRREQLRELKALGFAAQPQNVGEGPQNEQDVINDFVKQHYSKLVRHARRHIRTDELTGDIPSGFIDARAVVDQAISRAVAEADKKPEKMNWLLWIYKQIHDELRRRRSEFINKQQNEVSVEETVADKENSEILSGYDVEKPLDVVGEQLQPSVAKVEEIIPDRRELTPDKAVETKELLENLQSAIQTWDRTERDVFELYFVEGFEPFEIAMILQIPTKKVQQIISSIQDKIRNELIDSALV
ncbi:MAG: ribosome hibernation-promoting factor, HPF/YfiA family [Verrucomicrobiia bacterium]